MLIFYVAMTLVFVSVAVEDANSELAAYHSQPNRISVIYYAEVPNANVSNFSVNPVCVYNDHLGISENMDATIHVFYGNNTSAEFTLYEAYNNWQSGNSSGIQYVDADHDLNISEGDYILVPHYGDDRPVDYVYMSGKYLAYA
jgi:hypothetical protein